jgi:hypothetical protein
MEPIELLRDRMKGRSLRALAREIPCSAPYLSDILNGNRAAGPKILAFLGLTKVETPVTYMKVNGNGKHKGKRNGS